MPIFDPDGKCPLLNKKCIKHQCVWYNMLQGTDPQTGAPIQEWGCSIAWLPLMLVEVSGQVVKTTAATESFRNEMVAANMANQQLQLEQMSREEREKYESNKLKSIFEMIGNHQKAMIEKDEMLQERYIRLLSNNKIKVKDPNDPTSKVYKMRKEAEKKIRQEKANNVKIKKGKKDGNNSK
tara:strand:+ start:422 stop:964 length:543 start_codon:yes stop_codon:yes gene_type:complete